MKKTIASALAIVLTVAGCATDPRITEARLQDQEFEKYKLSLPEPDADYGTYPTDYQDLIRSYMAKTLKDPESVRYTDFTIPRKEHAIQNKKAIYGYSACVLVNAKNSYGGYVGNQQYWFFFQNGKLIRSQNITTGFKIIYLGRPVNCQNP